jgi:hypothetical protein
MRETRPELKLPAWNDRRYRVRPPRFMALTGPHGQPAIPHISHDQRHGAASGGIWLHEPEMSQGHQSVPELVLLLVAGVGFEPT